MLMEAMARIMDNLRSLRAAFPRAGFPNDILIAFTYSSIKVLLKLIYALSAVQLLTDELILSNMIV